MHAVPGIPQFRVGGMVDSKACNDFVGPEIKYGRMDQDEG